MGPKRIPSMIKREYDSLIRNQYMCRISFKGGKYPHIAPFLYIFDGNYLFFLSTKYGKKIEYFRENPHVTVEIDNYHPDLSDYKFVTLSGRLVEVKDEKERVGIRSNFVKMIKEKKFSKNIMIALGHSIDEPIEAIVDGGDRTLVWKLVGVEKITGLKSSP